MENTARQQDSPGSDREAIAAEARSLIRRGLKAILATLDAGSGHPYASLLTTATTPDGTPLFLISTLARHTQNLLADPRASILFDGTGGLGDPLEGGRVSVTGRAEQTDDEAARARFLARHPGAAGYADFADFAFYRLRLEGAHFVGGFGRIHDLEPVELTVPTQDADAVLAAEAEIVSHMNEDHADAVELYATTLLGGAPGPWRLTGCDPEGCDLALADQALRLAFPQRVTTPNDVRKAFVALSAQARG